MRPAYTEQLLQQTLLRLCCLQRLVGNGCKLFVEDKENQIAFVLRIIEQCAKPHVRALGDLTERCRLIPVPGKQFAHRGAYALPLFDFVLFPKSELV